MPTAELKAATAATTPRSTKCSNKATSLRRFTHGPIGLAISNRIGMLNEELDRLIDQVRSIRRPRFAAEPEGTSTAG